MTLDGSTKGGDITVEPIATKRGKIAFAAFRAPIDYVAQGVYINALSDSGSNKIWLPFRKPPVVLVHGVWSDNTAWNGLAERLRNSGFDVCKECLPDYGTKQPAGSFDPFATDENDRYVIKTLITATEQALMSLRWQNVAVTQVDVVGHSMGGLVAPARVASTFDDYYKPGNYWRGNFHKIITVGSPHKGTKLADWLIQHRNDLLNSIGKYFTKSSGTIEGLFESRGRPFDRAIPDFQTSSQVIRNLGETRVSSHAIIGVAPRSPSISDSEDNLNRLIGLRINNNHPNTVDEILENEDHDTIVQTGCD